MTLPDRPVVLIAEELAPAALEVLADDFEVRHVDGTDRSALLAALADADAVIVRSATQVDAEASPPPRGSRSSPAPASDWTTSTCRPRPPAASWSSTRRRPTSSPPPSRRSRCCSPSPAHRRRPGRAEGRRVEAHQVHRRRDHRQDRRRRRARPHRRAVRAADGRVRHAGSLAYDPYVQPARAAQLGVRLVGLDELLRESDFISIHLPKTPGDRRPHRRNASWPSVKPGVRIINAARGGLVDEHALADAIKDGRVGGAGLDVYSKEPCADSPLFAFDNVVAPRTWAPRRSRRRTRPASPSPAACKLALQGEFVPDAVNVQAGGVVAEEVRPLLPLAEKLGRVFTAVAGGVAARGHRRGARRGRRARRVGAAARRAQGPLRRRGRGTGHLRQRAAAGRRARGRARPRRPSPRRPSTRNLVTVRGALPDGRVVSVSGTYLSGPREELEADRGRRLRHSSSSPRACCCSSDTPTVPASSARRLDPRRGGGQHRGHAGGPARRPVARR